MAANLRGGEVLIKTVVPEEVEVWSVLGQKPIISNLLIKKINKIRRNSSWNNNNVQSLFCELYPKCSNMHYCGKQVS